jgi:hypothetical protein
MDQMDLLNDGIVTKVKMAPQAADATRRSGYTCWNWCKDLAPEMHPSKYGVYRLCKSVGCKCFPVSEVCEWLNPPLPQAPPKPKSSGWSDF